MSSQSIFTQAYIDFLLSQLRDFTPRPGDEHARINSYQRVAPKWARTYHPTFVGGKDPVPPSLLAFGGRLPLRYRPAEIDYADVVW